MSQFRYVKNKLHVEGLSVPSIIKNNKTPFYLYSQRQIENNFQSFKKNFKNINPLICFATKANTNHFILKLLGNLGAGADVVSGGELLKSIKSGIKPNKIVFSGVGKTADEIQLAIKKNILLINIESESEARLINQIAKKLNKKISVGFRINPDVDAKTHKKISTGKAENKFGISIKEFLNIYKNKATFNSLKIDALSVHIGSQILSDNPYQKTLNILTSIILKNNINLKYVDLGGGFGINYQSHQKEINLSRYSKLVQKFQKKINCKIIFEPGRFILGNAGILINKVQYIKKGTKKTFAILDAGMNDFMRPALYDAYHDIIPLIKSNKKYFGLIEFVGPICETTCKFNQFKNYQKIAEGDYMAIKDVGAYGSSLSSNYNTRPLIAEIIVKNKTYKIIRKKQDLLKLIKA